MRRLTLLLFAFTILLVTACGGGDGGDDRDTAADLATTGDTPGGDATTDASEDSADGVDDATAPDAVTVGGCSEAELTACEYPLLETGFTIREGVSIEEPQTGRMLPLRVRVPDGEGPFPVVIWSHGGGFNNGGHLLGNEWADTFARHGFAVINIGHSEPDGDAGLAWCELASVPSDECMPGDEDANGLLAVARAYDLVAVLDALPMLSQASVDNGGPAIDLERVVVGGWSGGARGPSMMFGAELQTSASSPRFSLPDERPVAVLMLSPAGDGFGGYFVDGAESSWDGMRGPGFVATGQNDVKPLKPELDGPTRRMAFDYQPDDGTRWMLYSNLEVGVGGHGTYNLEDLDSDDERLSRLSLSIRSGVLAFLDAHVRDDAEARAWLESDNARILAGDVDWLNP